MKLFFTMGAIALLAAASVQANTITYDFNDGTMQGWTNKSVSSAAAGYINLTFVPAQKAGAQNGGLFSQDPAFIPAWGTVGGGGGAVPPTGLYFLGEIPMTNYGAAVNWAAWPNAGSGAHQTLWIQPPPFCGRQDETVVKLAI